MSSVQRERHPGFSGFFALEWLSILHTSLPPPLPHLPLSLASCGACSRSLVLDLFPVWSGRGTQRRWRASQHNLAEPLRSPMATRSRPPLLNTRGFIWRIHWKGLWVLLLGLSPTNPPRYAPTTDSVYVRTWRDTREPIGVVQVRLPAGVSPTENVFWECILK